MIPYSLRLSGFLSYNQPVEIDFSQFELACISGANGAGKSSILDAITWVLFGQARRRDDAIINSHASTAEVVFEFSYENDRYRVQRIKPNGKATILEFFIQDSHQGWKPLTEHTVRDTEDRIRQILRLDYDTFTNASFFLQGKADQFAQQKPGDRKRILSAILGLDAWEAYRDRSAAARKRLENRQTGIDSLLKEIEEELSQETVRKERLVQLAQELDHACELRKVRETQLDQARQHAAQMEERRTSLDLLAEQVRISHRRLDERRALFDTRCQEQRRYQESLQRADQVKKAYQTWLEARSALETFESTAVVYHELKHRRTSPLLELENQRSRLTLECQSLTAKKSEMDTLAAGLTHRREELQTLQDQVEHLTVQLAEREALDREQSQLRNQLTDLKAENINLRRRMEEIRERIERLDQVTSAECPLCGQPLDALERDTLKKSLQEEGTALGDRFRGNSGRVKEGETRIAEIEQDLVYLKKMELRQRDLHRNLDQALDRFHRDEQALQDWEESGSDRLEEVNHLLGEETYAPNARAQLAEIDRELIALGYIAEAHENARRIEQEGRTSEDALRVLEHAQAALGPLEREIQNLSVELEQEGAALQQLEQAYLQAKTRLEQDFASTPDRKQVENDLFAAREQENRLRVQMGAAQQNVAVLDVQRARRQELNRQREEIARQIARFKILERACSKDGVPALLIEQALPEIETQTNEILDRLSSGAMSVRFVTQKDYKDKNRDDKKETLDILISDSVGPREYELFSGGEAFRVNFAIRLALSRVLARRAGARLQTLVIDEGFGSQDADGRQRLIEAINNVRGDFARVLVITHLEELKDAFPARIEVDKGPEGSSVRVLV